MDSSTTTDSSATTIDWFKAVTPLISSVLGGSRNSAKGMPPAVFPNRLDSATNQVFDNSGWNANFGTGSLSSDRTQTPGSVPWIPIIVVALIVLLSRRT